MVDNLLLKVFTLDVRSNTEEQRAIEAQLNHVVPILRWQECQHRKALPHLLQVIQPGFVNKGGQASNESKKVKDKSPAGLTKLFH